jgi:SAM-dependent methyltransferase
MTDQPMDILNHHSAAGYWNSVCDQYPENLSILYAKKKQFDHELVPRWRSGRILDAGCGKGADALYFSTRFSEVHAVDHSREMTERAREYVAQHSCSSGAKVTIRTEDIRELPYEDGFFDVTCSFSVIDHIPNPHERDRAIQELFRVTRPGGHLVLTFPNFDSLPAMLRREQEFVVRPGRVGETDFVEVVSRSQYPGCLEYQFEATYGWDKMVAIGAELGLARCEVRSGVMTDCYLTDSCEQIGQSPLEDGWEFLVEHVESGHLHKIVGEVYEEWSRIPTYRRGVRVGLVGERSAA